MDFFEASKKRYSYRGAYQQTSIPSADLKKIAEAGIAAPSGCNKQTTSCIIVDAPEVVASVGTLLQRTGFRGGNAPTGIVVLTQKIPGYGNVYFNVQDYSAAIENMLLAITSLGYASCWIEGNITANPETQKKMAEILTIPAEYTVVAYLPVGVPETEGKRPQYKPFSERVWYNTFGKTL